MRINSIDAEKRTALAVNAVLPLHFQGSESVFQSAVR